MIRLVMLNARRTPKPDGKKKKVRTQPEEPVEEVVDEPQEEFQNNPSLPQANPFAKKHGKRGSKLPTFVGNFVSSNIDALAYDPDKKQLWVRFMGGDVYTYWDVPIQIYRGFWSAPSKGHYFWEKIRKNKHIKYQRLTASLNWIPVKPIFRLNANKQANTASIAKSLKTRVKKDYSDWNVLPNIVKVFNGHQVCFEEFLVDIVRYGNKVRVDIRNNDTHQVDFSTTTATETTQVVDHIIRRIKRFIS